MVFSASLLLFLSVVPWISYQNALHSIMRTICRHNVPAKTKCLLAPIPTHSHSNTPKNYSLVAKKHLSLNAFRRSFPVCFGLSSMENDNFNSKCQWRNKTNNIWTSCVFFCLNWWVNSIMRKVFVDSQFGRNEETKNEHRSKTR